MFQGKSRYTVVARRSAPIPMNSTRIFAVVVLIWGAGRVLAAQSGTPECHIPIWSKEALADLRYTRTGVSPSLLPLDSNRAGVVFLDNERLIVYEVGLDSGQLSSRKSPDISSSFRLRLSVLDANSGKLAFTKDWGTRAHDSAIHVTTGGVLVKTGEIARLYTPDFAKSQDLMVPLSRNSWLMTSVSPTGKTIMGNRLNQGLNVSHFDVFDASTLKTLYSWSESPPLYHHYSISDEAIAAVDFNNHSVVISEFGTKRWRTVGKGSGLCASMNMPTLYSDQQLVYGCDKLIATSTDGHVLMTDSFPTGDKSSGKTTVAQAGRFVAISVDTTKVKTHILSEPSVRITATHIAVYDLVLKKQVFTVKVEPLPKNDYDFALSPDGSKLAILNDRNVSVCVVPVQLTEQTETGRSEPL